MLGFLKLYGTACNVFYSQSVTPFSYMKIEIQTKLLITTAFSFSFFFLFLAWSEVFSKGSSWIYFLNLFTCFSLQFLNGFYL